MCQNDPEEKFEGDIFAQTAPILQWHDLDQTLGVERYYCQVQCFEQHSRKAHMRAGTNAKQILILMRKMTDYLGEGEGRSGDNMGRGRGKKGGEH